MLSVAFVGILWEKIRPNLRRGTAMLATCIIIFSYTLPVLASEGSESQKDLYAVDQINLCAYPSWEGTRYHGPDVDENGMISMEVGNKYNFSLEASEFSNAGTTLYYSLFNWDYGIGASDAINIRDNWWGQISEQPYAVLMEFESLTLVPIPMEKKGKTSKLI